MSKELLNALFKRAIEDFNYNNENLEIKDDYVYSSEFYNKENHYISRVYDDVRYSLTYYINIEINRLSGNIIVEIEKEDNETLETELVSMHSLF